MWAPRTIGSVLEDALRKLIADEAAASVSRIEYALHTVIPEKPGHLPGVDLEDMELMAELLDERAGHAPA